LKALLNAIIDFVRGEPVLVAQLIPLIVAAGAVFGLKLSPENVGEAVAIAEAVAVILARHNVTPTSSLPITPAASVPPAPVA
jgi:hypothetical protein